MFYWPTWCARDSPRPLTNIIWPFVEHMLIKIFEHLSYASEVKCSLGVLCWVRSRRLSIASCAESTVAVRALSVERSRRSYSPASAPQQKRRVFGQFIQHSSLPIPLYTLSVIDSE